MVRSKLTRTKIHLNISSIGPVDQRKTILTSAIPTTLSIYSPECTSSKLEEMDSVTEE